MVVGDGVGAEGLGLAVLQVAVYGLLDGDFVYFLCHVVVSLFFLTDRTEWTINRPKIYFFTARYGGRGGI